MFRVEGEVIPTSNFVLYVKGRCTGFAFHVSGEYLLVTSDAGGVYLFSVESG
jgi:hypothetical protein